MERPVRNPFFLKHVPEGPVAVAVRHVAQSGKQGSAGHRVQVGVVNRTEGIVAGIELGNVHRHAFVLREGIDQVPGLLHLRDQEFRIVHLMVQVPGLVFRRLAQVGVAGYKIHRQLFVPAERKEIRDPLLAPFTAADGRTADLHAGQDLFHRADRDPVQLQICRLIGALPEAGKVRLVPDLAGPGLHLFPAVTVNQVLQRFPHQAAPLLRILRGNGMRFPVKQRLFGGSQFFRHEAQLQERLQAVLQPGVDHPVQIGEAEPLLPFEERRPEFLPDSHLVAEQAVSADVAEMAFLLHGCHLLMVFLMERQVHPAGADAVVGQVPESGCVPGMNNDLPAHIDPPVFRFRVQYIGT